MSADILKKLKNLNSAVMSDRDFSGFNPKVAKMKTGIKPKECKDIYSEMERDQFKPSWKQMESDSEDESENTEIKGKDLLKRIYQGGKKVAPSKILDSVVKTESKIIKHLEEHIKEGNYDKKDISQSKQLRKQIHDVASAHLTPALKIPKTAEIWKYSNPKTAQEKAFKIYGKSAVLYKSERADKKYQILNPSGDWVHFGQMEYQDFTKHRDQARRENYLRRASAIKGDWRKNEYSPNALAMRILW